MRFFRAATPKVLLDRASRSMSISLNRLEARAIDKGTVWRQVFHSIMDAVTTVATRTPRVGSVGGSTIGSVGFDCHGEESPASASARSTSSARAPVAARGSTIVNMVREKRAK